MFYTMKKIYSLMIALLFVGSIFAQEKISKTGTAPEMDGYPDDVWETAKAYPIDKPFLKETPSVTATWQALYDDENFYVIVTVEDENHWPGWEIPGDNWLYDKPEVYWDVNEVLDDGVGAGKAGTGHYQLADGFLDGSYDTPITKEGGNQNPGGTYCYSLVGEGYIYEHAVPLANLKDANGVAITATTVRPIGFDVTVIDQDEGVTTGRQRCVWSCDGNGNNGSTDEAWNNLDGAGEIVLKQGAAKALKNRSMTVTPNPAVSNITINADFNKVEISNILGQQVKSISATSKTVNVSDLAKGVYVVKAYKNGTLQGTAKITKN
jgi:hypothetical protein